MGLLPDFELMVARLEAVHNEDVERTERMLALLAEIRDLLKNGLKGQS